MEGMDDEVHGREGVNDLVLCCRGECLLAGLALVSLLYTSLVPGPAS